MPDGGMVSLNRTIYGGILSYSNGNVTGGDRAICGIIVRLPPVTNKVRADTIEGGAVAPEHVFRNSS